jgi:hypothetical protein
MRRELVPSEARLIYVAVTRARRLLDLTGITWVDDYEKTAASEGPPVVLLSLTAQLKHDDSPMSQFMTEHLPRSLNVQRDYLARLAGLPHPVQPIDVQYPHWSALGHAIDYRVRLSFGGGLGVAVDHGVAALNGHVPGSPAGPTQRAIAAAGRKLLTIEHYSHRLPAESIEFK